MLREQGIGGLSRDDMRAPPRTWWSGHAFARKRATRGRRLSSRRAKPRESSRALFLLEQRDDVAVPGSVAISRKERPSGSRTSVRRQAPAAREPRRCSHGSHGKASGVHQLFARSSASGRRGEVGACWTFNEPGSRSKISRRPADTTVNRWRRTCRSALQGCDRRHRDASRRPPSRPAYPVASLARGDVAPCASKKLDGGAVAVKSRRMQRACSRRSNRRRGRIVASCSHRRRDERASRAARIRLLGGANDERRPIATGPNRSGIFREHPTRRRDRVRALPEAEARPTGKQEVRHFAIVKRERPDRAA